MKFETRQSRPFELRMETRAEGAPGMSGMAVRYGQLDSYRTVFAPGCARACLADFIASGSFLAAHDADDLAIGFVRDAVETPQGVEVELEYHTTPAAMEARTVAQERLNAGKKVGLSIGFAVSSYVECESGQALLDTAASLGMDLSVFDQEAIRARASYCYLITQLSQIYEVSQVNFPAVPESEASAVRSENDLGAAPGLTLMDQLTTALGAVEAVTQRGQEVSLLRSADNKQLGKATLDGFKAVRAAIDELINAAEAPTTLERQQAKFAQVAETLK